MWRQSSTNNLLLFLWAGFLHSVQPTSELSKGNSLTLSDAAIFHAILQASHLFQRSSIIAAQDSLLRSDARYQAWTFPRKPTWLAISLICSTVVLVESWDILASWESSFLRSFGMKKPDDRPLWASCPSACSSFSAEPENHKMIKFQYQCHHTQHKSQAPKLTDHPHLCINIRRLTSQSGREFTSQRRFWTPSHLNGLPV